jgi:CRISPR-associated protein Csb1
MDDEQLNRFDCWLDDDGPAALVIREHLVPVEGPDGVVFPATFAAGGDFKGGYNIDQFSNSHGNVCLIDSVGSQANRIEPLFIKPKYTGLVPQIVIKAGEKRVNLLEAGHRAGDAIVRCSALQNELRDAFKAVQRGDTHPLAKIAPTSIVFGAWDSRDTQAKLPRLIVSTIRAYDVRELTRSAQYIPAVDYVHEGLLAEPEDLRDAEGKVKGKHPFAQRGYSHHPAPASHGGVIAGGGIRRDASLHLAGLRLLRGRTTPKDTQSLRRYVLGLALTAFTSPVDGYLRQGCHLVFNPEKAREFQEVYNDGQRKDATLTHANALAYAREAARAFGLDPDRTIDFSAPPDREVEFDKELAQKDVTGEGDNEKRPRKSGKGKAAETK